MPLLEAKLALTNKGLHDFLEMFFTLLPAKLLRVNLQLAADDALPNPKLAPSWDQLFQVAEM